MGCDGGTIPRRDELVRVKKKPEAKDKDAELAFKWRCCTITQEILQKPIVMCHLGKLYSKMALIEALLDRSTLAPEYKYIKSLKDVKDLKLTENPEFGKDESGRAAPYICPVLGLEMNGTFRFVAVWSCGCVFSERALKEIGTKNCHKCTKPFEDDDIVIINGNEEDLELMTVRMEIRQQKNKKNKEKKVKVKLESEESDVSTNNSSGNSEATTSKTLKRTSNGLKLEENSKKPKTESTSLSKIGNIIASGKVTKAEEVRKIKSDYSVAKDKNVSDVYKSLFTSHKSEKEQNRAHWVTYNPFYN